MGFFMDPSIKPSVCHLRINLGCICSNIGQAGKPPIRLQCLFVCGSITHKNGGIATLPVKKWWQPQIQITNEIQTTDPLKMNRKSLALFTLKRLVEKAVWNSGRTSHMDYGDYSS
ncbi:uncharacterized protein [Amphiura filiformis]|uniref:uncharacterized protein n=1 Tax=Amphiura filiformis TaxID=82378 RepID=UPI003B22256D